MNQMTTTTKNGTLSQEELKRIKKGLKQSRAAVVLFEILFGGIILFCSVMCIKTGQFPLEWQSFLKIAGYFFVLFILFGVLEVMLRVCDNMKYKPFKNGGYQIFETTIAQVEKDIFFIGSMPNIRRYYYCKGIKASINAVSKKEWKCATAGMSIKVLIVPTKHGKEYYGLL